MEKICPHCKELFMCLVENISECACSKIQISADLKQWMSKYDDCICVNCLMRLDHESLD
ncbi:MAG: cysteine-rich CWC family protein [Bacteroidota bacterium]|jgi:hypothetical protein